jgi:NAD(P)-dependent dehydrogenase (short-subunit alcohol dehydrogenase family)
MLERFSLDGKVAIVTGGGTNLGKAMCHALARAGANLVIAARTRGPLEETAAEVRALGRHALVVPTDVTDSAQVNALVSCTVEKFGTVDILVNNAGVAKGIEPSPRDPIPKPPGPIWEFTDDMWHQANDINLTGAFYCCRAVARHMLERKSGRIINISSVAGLRAARNLYSYGAAKAGVIHLTKTLAYSWARHHVNVNCIAPGFFRTAEVDPRIVEREALLIPMGRAGEPAELGGLTVFLASEASDYVTGECFIIDGARSMCYGPVDWRPIIPLGMDWGQVQE